MKEIFLKEMVATFRIKRTKTQEGVKQLGGPSSKSNQFNQTPQILIGNESDKY